MNLKLTNGGINALLRTQSGDGIVFTKIKIGNGAAQSVATAEDLSNPLKTLEITNISVANQKASLSTSLNNANVEAGFRMTEIGVFAQDQDDSSEEFLYAYGMEPEGTADYIAASGDSVLEVEITIDVFVSNADNIAAIINESLQYPTLEMWWGHVNDMNNPHQTTKEHVGLGRVPNVYTNDQTVTYTPPATDQELVSGERHEVAFGKIARAVSRLFTHIANKNNPHDVKVSQIGAAAASHTHSATDINSGILNVGRGGTGKSSWLKNQLVYLASTSEFAQLAFPAAAGMVLHQGTSGAPYWAFASATEWGNYLGNGKCGSGNKTSLTFSNGLPSIIFIIQTSVNGTQVTADWQWGMIFPQQGKGISFDYSVNPDLTHAYDLYVSTSGNVVSWYSTRDAPTQLTGSSTFRYYYVGIR
jgi:hypothetical protein